MRNYTINKIGWIGIILTMSCLAFSSCKKEDNKAMGPSSPPTTVSTVSDKYAIENYNSNSNNVNDTIFMITNGTDVKLTIPVDYGLDTMQLIFDTVSNNKTFYTYDHVVRHNSAYKLIGRAWRDNTNGSLTVECHQRISPYGVANYVQLYMLDYTKQ
jgi:hypothetical protein